MKNIQLFFSQVNKMFPTVIPIRTNSLENDFQFVGQMFCKTGRDIQIGINDVKTASIKNNTAFVPR